MGAWSTKAFGNDAALDMALELDAARDLGAFKARLELALSNYEQYDARRDRGENKKVWTEEYVLWVLSHIEPSVDPDIENMMRQEIGKEHLDSGSDPAFEVVAVGAITLAACRRNTVALTDDVHTSLLKKYKPTLRAVEEVIRVMRLIPKNKELCRDCGAAWKKGVLKLADELATCAGELHR